MQEAFLTPRVSEDRGDMNSEGIPRSGGVNEATIERCRQHEYGVPEY
jgi:hypothetical protein